MSNLLGGNSKGKNSSNTSNQAYGFLQNQFAPVTGQTANASGLVGSLLGVPGSDPSAGAAGLNDYKNQTGYQFQMDQGTGAINDNAASRGLLQSGSTAKALQGYGQGLASNTFNSYISNLMGLGNQGIAAGGVIGNAGQTSTSSGKTSSKQGLGL